MHVLANGDVLISRLADPLGRACIFPEQLQPCVTAVDVCIFRSGPDGVDHNWLMHFINSTYFRNEIELRSSGTTRKRISRKNLGDIEMCVPPLAEQRWIVAKIEALQERSQQAREALSEVEPLLEQFRQSVLAAAFRGDLTADWRAAYPEVEPASELLHRIRAERRRRWEQAELAKYEAKGQKPPQNWKGKYKEPEPVDDSGLPELPEGWVWASFGEVFEVYVGATPSRQEPKYWNGPIPWVSSGEVAFCRIDATRESITELGLARSSTELHPKGTVLLGMIGEGKTRGQAAILDIAACNSQNSAAIRVSKTPIPPEYIFVSFNQVVIRVDPDSH